MLRSALLSPHEAGPLPPADKDTDPPLIVGSACAENFQDVASGENFQDLPSALPDDSEPPPEPNWLSYSEAAVNFEDGDREEEVEDNTSIDETYCFPDKDPPVYSGAPITLNESLVAILTMALRFSLSGKCIQALLQLIQLHCLKAGNVMKPSLYLFKKYFSHLRGAIDYEYYCSKCFSKCEKSVGCSTTGCDKKTELCCLIKIPLAPQLQTLLKRKGFYSLLQFISARPNSSDLSDIFYGNLYGDHIELGILGTCTALSLMWYTDGAALFKSSRISVWPLFLSINELPYSERFKKENLLVAALWCGPVQPHGNIILKAVYPDLKKLAEGVSLEIEDQGEKVIKAVVLNGTGDTPARALMLNMVKHNGQNCCQKCEQEGEPREGCFGVRVFPYKPEEMVPRTDEKLCRQGDLATNLNHAYMGVKGRTLLSNMTYSAVRGTSLNSMHLIYGGIAKINVKFFLDSDFAKLECNLDKESKILVDQRLLAIKPPHYLTRVPKSLNEYATWKTSIHKSMFLYYALPVFVGIVPKYHLEHYASLVAAVHYLNSDKITPECLVKAERLIAKYVSYFQDFYDVAYMTLTVHLLLHLVELVKELGPMWLTGCFALEGVNGEILNLVHGTRFPEAQIASSLQMCLGLEDLVNNLRDSDAKKFCVELLTHTNICKSIKIGDVTIYGEWEKLSNFPNYLLEPLKKCGMEEKTLYKFNSIRFQKVLYVAESYTRSLSRDSSCVEYYLEDNIHVGILKLFLRSAVCSCKMCSCKCDLFAVVEELEIIEHFKTLVPDITVPNIHGYGRLNSIVIIPVNSLKSVCVKMLVDNNLYIAKRCNKHETE